MKHKWEEPNLEAVNMTDEQLDEINAEVDAEALEEGMVISRDVDSETKPLTTEEQAEKEARNEEDMWVKSKERDAISGHSPMDEYAAEREADEYEQTMVDSSDDESNHVVDEDDEVYQ